MSEQLVHNGQARRIANAGSKKSIREGDLENNQLIEGQEVTIFATQVPADKVYAHGAGSDDRQNGRDAFIHADLRATGNGDGAADANITGDLVAVITDSEQLDVHARYEVGDLGDLRDAASDSRTDKPKQPVRVPIAREDQHLELRVVADANADGYEVASGGQSDDVRVYYTDISA